MTYDLFSDFTRDVELDLADVHERISEGIDHVLDTWHQTIAARGLDSNWGWLSPGLKLAYEHFKGNLEEEIARLWSEFETFCTDVWTKVDELAGDPWMLMQMNESYLATAARLRDEKPVLRDLMRTVGRRWSGLAYDAYAHVALYEQTPAIRGVDAALVTAATACARGAEQVRSVWREVISALLSLVDTVLDCIKDGTDAGQWVTFDAGPAIRVMGKSLTEVLRLWNDLSRYFDTNETVNRSLWTDLNNGVDGLDANNDWPRISGHDREDLDDRDAWDVA